MRLALLLSTTLSALVFLFAGCAEPPPTVHLVGSSEDTIDPKAPTTATPAAAKSLATPDSTDTQDPVAIRPVDLTAPVVADSTKSEPSTAEPAAVVLKPATFDEFQKFLASNSGGGVKYTLVDAWATFCGPCKENFPHVVEMHHKYGPKGLRVISISFDDPEDARAVKEAEAFLHSQNAVTTNILLNEENGVAFEKFDVNAIPAVFLYGPDGKEIRRFTLDDPSKQFTYADVEQAIAELLGAAPSEANSAVKQ